MGEIEKGISLKRKTLNGQVLAGSVGVGQCRQHLSVELPGGPGIYRTNPYKTSTSNYPRENQSR